MTNTNQNTKEMLTRYSSLLKSALNDGLTYTKLLNQLVDSENKAGLLEAAKELVRYQLDNSYLKYPQQFSPEDYYLIFMNRLFEQNGHQSLLSVASDGSTGKLSQQLSPLGSGISFYFKINSDQNGGAFYYASNYDEPLFYINLSDKILKFNSKALTKLFLIDLFAEDDMSIIQQAVNILRQFGELLIQDYQFKVNFSILENHDDYFYHFNSEDLSKSVLDQLFIIAARNNYMLKSYHIVGAELTLDSAKLEIYPQKNVWGLQVVDGANKYSWLELMLKHDFLRQWYLNNIGSLEISVDDSIFS